MHTHIDIAIDRYSEGYIKLKELVRSNCYEGYRGLGEEEQ